MFGLLLTALTLLLVYVLQRLQRLYTAIKHLNQFGVPEGNHWLFGDLLTYPGTNEEGLKWVTKQMETHPKCMSFRLLAIRHSVVVWHPETVKAILKSSAPKDIKAPYGYLLPWLGDGLLISSGAKWHRNRRLLTPAFHYDILKPYMEVFNNSADKLCSALKRRASKEKSVEMFGLVSSSTLESILQCAFSKEEPNLQTSDKPHPILTAVEEASHIFDRRIFNPLLQPDFLFWPSSTGRRFAKHCRYLHRVSESMIRERRKQIKNDPTLLSKKRLDFIDILLTARDADGEGLSDLDIRNEADTFLFEGHDTTASGICWVLKELAEHPEHAARCRQEVRELLQDRDCFHWEDMSKLPHLTMCIKEAFRIHSPVPGVARMLTEDLEMDGKIVPAGTPVDIAFYALHLNPAVWGKNARDFLPERFSPDNTAKMDPFAFVPFSAGSRNCIGQQFAMNEVKVTVAKILMNFDLAPDTSRKPRLLYRMVTRTEDGLYIRAKPLQA